MAKGRLIINIDCPPGGTRPGHVATQVGMEWTDNKEELKPGMFLNTSRVFGNWTFELESEDIDALEVLGKKLFNKLTPFYPNTIRYADWAVPVVEIPKYTEEVK